LDRIYGGDASFRNNYIAHSVTSCPVRAPTPPIVPKREPNGR
jgi:hypothetical protein